MPATTSRFQLLRSPRAMPAASWTHGLRWWAQSNFKSQAAKYEGRSAEAERPLLSSSWGRRFDCSSLSDATQWCAPPPPPALAPPLDPPELPPEAEPPELPPPPP